MEIVEKVVGLILEELLDQSMQSHNTKNFVHGFESLEFLLLKRVNLVL
jgi:hypothetical protein